MDNMMDKSNSPHFSKPINFVSPVTKFKSTEEKMARFLAKIVADRAGRVMEVSISDLSEQIRIGVDELISFCKNKSNLSRVRTLVSQRMYGIKLSFDGNYLCFGAIR
tara:strand:- start:166 stop:486 length:321 start_codon:yes stop_codon:yes gene_type:complete